MNKNFVIKYKTKLMLTHFIVSLLSIVGMLSLYFILNWVFNGVFVDIIAKLFKYRTAFIFSINKEYIFLISVVLVLVLGWIIVEMRAVGKLADVIKNMDVVFSKDEERLVLSKEFKDIEKDLNDLKFENIRNERLAQAEAQRKTDLITYLAHDIKTPLASVIGYLSLLDEAPDMPLEQRAKYTKITLEKAYRLEQLINEFFDITRFNLSTIPLEKENINLHFMFEQMIDEFYPMLTPGNRRVRLMVDENMVIYGDADKLARVFNNILKNAIAYSFENSVIEISARKQDDKVYIEFRNKGRVIPPHKLDTIFEKFFRLDTARSSNTGGAGLGLAIAKGIVVQHGGDILAESSEEATVFTVLLPAAKR